METSKQGATLTDVKASMNEVNKTNKQAEKKAEKARLAGIEAKKLADIAKAKEVVIVQKAKAREEKRIANMAMVQMADKHLSKVTDMPVLLPGTSAVTIRIVQMTNSAKTTFEMETNVVSKKADTATKGLAKKTAFIVADSLYTQCKEAMDEKERWGHYITSFRPRAFFKVFIIVDSVCTFAAINTKGSDAIRLFRKNGKTDELVSRGELAAKFSLLAGIAQANQTFAELVSFELSVDSALIEEQNNALQLEANNG